MLDNIAKSVNLICGIFIYFYFYFYCYFFFKFISGNYASEKAPIPSEMANNNFCFKIVYLVYGGKSIRLKLVIL